MRGCAKTNRATYTMVKFSIGHFKRFFIDYIIQSGFDDQPDGRGRAANQLNDSGGIDERLATPVFGYETEHFMLDFVPFTGARTTPPVNRVVVNLEEMTRVGQEPSGPAGGERPAERAKHEID